MITMLLALLLADSTPAADRDETVEGWALSYRGAADADLAVVTMKHSAGPVTITYSRAPGTPHVEVSSSKCAAAGWSSASDLTVGDDTPQPIAVQAHAFADHAIGQLAGDCADEAADAAAAVAGFDAAAKVLEGWLPADPAKGQ